MMCLFGDCADAYKVEQAFKATNHTVNEIIEWVRSIRNSHDAQLDNLNGRIDELEKRLDNIGNRATEEKLQ